MVRSSSDDIDSLALAKELDQWLRKMKCSGSTGIRLEDFSDICVGVEDSPVEEDSPTYEPYTQEQIEDKLEKLNGEQIIEFPQGYFIQAEFVNGLRHGYCKLSCPPSNKGVISVSGTYSKGQMCGKVKIGFKEGGWVEGYFKQGVLHGFARFFDKKGRLSLVGVHQNGVPCGTCWKVMRGGGCVVGRPNKQGQFTGIRMAYIFPDFQTCLVGSFRQGVFESGQEASIRSIIQGENGIKIPVFTKPEGHRHVRDVTNVTFDYLCSSPLVQDPYEKKMVEVRNSKIPGGNEGLFVLQDAEPNTVLAFYNGSRARPEDFDPDSWEGNGYKIYDPANMPHGTIDIPQWAQNVSSYQATLGHKTNHSFLPNAEFVVFNHPVFGLIPCVTSIHDIPMGEEVFVGYGYELEYSPDWYKQAWYNGPFKDMDHQDWINCNIPKRQLLHLK